MYDGGQRPDDPGNVIFRDLVTLALAGFVAMVFVMIPHLHPPAKNAAEDAKAPGDVSVEIRWPDGINADVDLWVKAPGDVPVGYSNRSGRVFDLLRDDLGASNDDLGLNYENSYSRGCPPGEYIVNVHYYRSPLGYDKPIQVVVLAKAKPSGGKSAMPLVKRTVSLTQENEELTVFRFTLDGHCELVPGSVNAAPAELRSAVQ